ncbi:MAG TPA: CxxxxCH/CxxCH domain-containing protein [Kofleriaceae bacterium]
MILLAACAEERPRPEGCEDCAVRLHPPGILDPSSEDFHGKLLAEINYDFARCGDCHGGDFQGGKVGVSCVTCHAQGPTDCSTCHGQGRESRAHAVHRDAQIGCAECHRVPAHWDDPGHIVDDGPPAEVSFGALAALTIAAADRAGPPTWDGERCSNVYCHGDVWPKLAGTDTRPRWDQRPSEFCSTGCHGLPPPDHASANCVQCHAGLRHVDGVVQVTGGSDGR